MMYPFMSPYLSMLRRDRTSPWDRFNSIGDEHDYATPPWNIDNTKPASPAPDEGYRGFSDKSARRRAIGEGLLGLGSQLLGSASTGDFAGGLARGASSYAEAFQAAKQRDRMERFQDLEEKRRQAEDERQGRQEARTQEAHELNQDIGRENLGNVRDERERMHIARERTGKSAQQMTDEINALAAKYPDNAKLQVMAKRATGYALGEDADLGKLDEIYTQMAGEAFWRSDFDREAGARRDAARGDIAAGVAADPKAAERRAEEELAISRGHLGVAQERARTDREDRTKQMTLLQSFDRIQDIATQKYDEKASAWDERSNGKPVPPAMKEQWKRESLEEAQREFRGLISTSYQYTADGQLLPDITPQRISDSKVNEYGETDGTGMTNYSKVVEYGVNNGLDKLVRRIDQRGDGQSPNVEVRPRPGYEDDPAIQQQIESIEKVMGPLTDDNRIWASRALFRGIRIPTVIARLKRLREDWRP